MIKDLGNPSSFLQIISKQPNRMFLAGCSLLLFSSSNPLWADTREDCSPVRLDAPGESMERIGVRDQGQMGICYATTAVTLADAWMESHLSEEHKALHPFIPSSALESALGSYRSRYPETILMTKKAGNLYAFEGGTTKEALNYLAQKGTCSEESIPDKNLLQKKRGSFFSSLEKTFQSVSKAASLFRNLKRSPTLSEMQEAKKRFLESLSCLETYQFSFKIGASSPEEVKELLGIAMANDFLTFAGKLFDLLCRERTKLPEHVLSDKVIQFTETSDRMLREAWGPYVSKKQPIGIGFCSHVLIDSSFIGRQDEIVVTEEDLREDCGLHGAFLMRREMNQKTKVCEYMIQNSSGTSCDYYDPSLRCENGKVWISKAQLDHNIFHMTYLKEAH